MYVCAHTYVWRPGDDLRCSSGSIYILFLSQGLSFIGLDPTHYADWLVSLRDRPDFTSPVLELQAYTTMPDSLGSGIKLGSLQILH